MDSDTKNLLLGAGLTTFGFVLTMAWDLYKTRSDVNSKNVKIKNLFINEMKSLREKKSEIESIIREEIKAIEEKKTLIISVPRISLISFGLIKIERPIFISSNFELEKKIYELESKVEYLNELLTYRESYKINNGAMSNFLSNLKHKNEYILAMTYQLEKLLESIDGIKI